MQKILFAIGFGYLSFPFTSAFAGTPSILVEEGRDLPPIALWSDSSNPVSDTVAVSIKTGLARFRASGQPTDLAIEASDGVYLLPAIIPGPVYDESYLHVNDHTETQIIRLVTLPIGGVSELNATIQALPILSKQKALPPDQFALLGHRSVSTALLYLANSHFAVVDEATFLESLRHHPDSAVRDTGIIISNFGDHLDKISMKGKGCFRTPVGPGLIKWGTYRDPAGMGYSVKPESSWPLVWGRYPSQDADGLYAYGWGCGDAFKIPDSCTLTVSSGFTCCNKAMMKLGHVPRWVDPGAIGWPPCPLCLPNCAERECGPNGCGGSCGTCPSDYVCNENGQCEHMCQPNCYGLTCGWDGCGGSCGTCPSDSHCSSGICRITNPECQAGDTKCEHGRYYICALDRWNQEGTCSSDGGGVILD